MTTLDGKALTPAPVATDQMVDAIERLRKVNSATAGLRQKKFTLTVGAFLLCSWLGYVSLEQDAAIGATLIGLGVLAVIGYCFSQAIVDAAQMRALGSQSVTDEVRRALQELEE